MGRIWSEQRRYETWLQVEIAAAEAMAAAGIVPAEAARELRDKGAFNIEVAGTGHMSMLFSRRIYDLVRENLEAPFEAARAAASAATS